MQVRRRDAETRAPQFHARAQVAKDQQGSFIPMRSPGVTITHVVAPGLMTFPDFEKPRPAVAYAVNPARHNRYMRPHGAA